MNAFRVSGFDNHERGRVKASLLPTRGVHSALDRDCKQRCSVGVILQTEGFDMHHTEHFGVWLHASGPAQVDTGGIARISSK